MGASAGCCKSVDPEVKNGLRPESAPADAPDEVQPELGEEDQKKIKSLKPVVEKKPPTRPKSIGKNKNGQNLDGEKHLPAHRKPRDKGKVTKDLIKGGMRSDRVCALFADEDMETIMNTMEYFTFRAGETIIKQGEAGQHFFVTHEGILEVSINGKIVNTVGRGTTFGSLALLYQCPRTATVVCKQDAGVWGGSGETFQKIVQDNIHKNHTANRQFVDSINLFDGLTAAQKELVCGSMFVETFPMNARVVTEGEAATAIYFIKKGELNVMTGAQILPNGSVEGGNRISQLRPGDCFGERAVLHNEPRGSTVVANSKCELLCIGVEQLKEVLGTDLAACLERNFILCGLKKSPIISLFSSSQQYQIVRVMEVQNLLPGAKLEDGLRFAVVMDGEVTAQEKETIREVTLVRGHWYEDEVLDEHKEIHSQNSTPKAKAAERKTSLTNVTAGQDGAKVAFLTRNGLAQALKDLGLAAIGSAEQAIDYTRKMLLAKKVHIFRHLSPNQTDMLVKSFVLQRYKQGATVIRQGEVGTSFFVIAAGEVKVLINGTGVRTLSKNAYMGERALLFDEPRSATVEVVSAEADLWSVEKSTFAQIVRGKMQDELIHRIRLQDTGVSLKDLKHLRLIGAGAAGVVRQVEHHKTQMRYALKRVRKVGGKIPEEVARECSLLAENDHPFVMHLVKTFETKSSVYILSQLITGGELHAAIRKIPQVLNRAQAQFYTGSLVLVMEHLQDRNIVYRDLKPENVMLDAQGYLKLIDFGIAKKLDESKSRTFTMIGTPHYMAPEVMRGHGYGTEVDIWSLGVMQYELVCGYLPFADELDDPTEVCTAVLKDHLVLPSGYRDQPGRTLLNGLLSRQPKKRLGAGINGYEDIKECEYFKIGYSSGADTLFNKIMGRELDPPVQPTNEVYCNPEDVEECSLSDAGELCPE